jgi:hypothetical protein
MEGKKHRHHGTRVFDWDKAAFILYNLKPSSASAGILEDWGDTSGPILFEGTPIENEYTYIFLSSKWGTPVLKVNNTSYDCWIFKKDSPGWHSKTLWPKTSLKILEDGFFWEWRWMPYDILSGGKWCRMEITYNQYGIKLELVHPGDAERYLSDNPKRNKG